MTTKKPMPVISSSQLDPGVSKCQTGLKPLQGSMSTLLRPRLPPGPHAAAQFLPQVLVWPSFVCAIELAYKAHLGQSSKALNNECSALGQASPRAAGELDPSLGIKWEKAAPSQSLMIISCAHLRGPRAIRGKEGSRAACGHRNSKSQVTIWFLAGVEWERALVEER